MGADSLPIDMPTHGMLGKCAVDRGRLHLGALVSLFESPHPVSTPVTNSSELILWSRRALAMRRFHKGQQGAPRAGAVLRHIWTLWAAAGWAVLQACGKSRGFRE